MGIVKAMPPSTEESVAARARQLWEQNGRPAGRDLDIWLQAERELQEPESVALPVVGPAVSNLEHTLPPGEKRRARAARHGDGPAVTTAPSPEHFVVVLDRAHLRVFEMKEAPGVLNQAQFELAESIDFPAGKRHYTAQDADQAGRFNSAGQAQGSIDERLPMQEEHQRRVVADLANFLDSYLGEHPNARWDLAAGPALHQPLLAALKPAVRARLGQSVVKDLVHQSPAELRSHFGRRP